MTTHSVCPTNTIKRVQRLKSGNNLSAFLRPTLQFICSKQRQVVDYFRKKREDLVLEREEEMAGDSSTGPDPVGRHPTLITAVHPDIIKTHILTRLDGATLASAGSASSNLRRITANDKLWQDICNQTWPSTADPLLRHLISTFAAGHRSFYSDSFPALHHSRPAQTNRSRRPPLTPKLISAVDINYQNKLIYSNVEERETAEGLSQRLPFQVDLLKEETVPLPAKLDFRGETCELELEKNLTLSWILIDQSRKRAANISSVRPVSVDRNWPTGDIQIRYGTVMSAQRRGEVVVFVVMVTCGESDGGELEVKEVSFHAENMDGETVTWEESLGILEAAMESGERRRESKGEKRERYQEFLKMKMERRLRKRRRETTLELVFIFAGVTTFLSFLAFVTSKFLQLLGFILTTYVNEVGTRGHAM